MSQDALETLIQALEGVGARYLIGGSVASSAQGLPRATLDTDLLVQIGPSKADALAKALGGDWYVDADCVIHMPTGHKFDLFPANSNFNVSCFVATPEDTILAKLQWYRDGGQVSDRQWSDITGMLVINRQPIGRDLDFDYLNQWAKQLGVVDLLEKAVNMTREPS